MHCARICASVLVLTIALGIAPLEASSLNIHFGLLGMPSSTYGAAADQPGVWNDISSLGVTNGLLDLGGKDTGISLNLIADSIMGAFGGMGDAGALRGYNFFSGGGHPWSVTLTGLSDGTYNVYYYSPTNVIVHTGSFSVNNVFAPNIQGNSTSTLNQGSDWAVVTNVLVGSGTLSLTSLDTANLRGLAGIQVVQTPEPAMPLLVGTALLAMHFHRAGHRRRCSALLLFSTDYNARVRRANRGVV